MAEPGPQPVVGRSRLVAGMILRGVLGTGLAYLVLWPQRAAVLAVIGRAAARLLRVVEPVGLVSELGSSRARIEIFAPALREPGSVGWWDAQNLPWLGILTVGLASAAPGTWGVRSCVIGWGVVIAALAMVSVTALGVETALINLVGGQVGLRLHPGWIVQGFAAAMENLDALVVLPAVLVLMLAYADWVGRDEGPGLLSSVRSRIALALCLTLVIGSLTAPLPEYDVTDTRRALEALHERNPGRAWPLLRQADLTPDRAEVARLVSRATEAEPSNAAAALRYIEVLEEMGRTDAAIGQCRALLARVPADIDVRARLARLLVGAGDLGGALEEARTVLARDPGHGEAQLALGFALAGESPCEALLALGRAAATGLVSPALRQATTSLAERCRSVE